MAAEPRHPRIVALGVTHRGVQEQQQRRRLEPRVSEVVDRVGEFQSIARTEMLHVHLVMSCSAVNADDSIRYGLGTWMRQFRLALGALIAAVLCVAPAFAQGY